MPEYKCSRCGKYPPEEGTGLCWNCEADDERKRIEEPLKRKIWDLESRNTELRTVLESTLAWLESFSMPPTSTIQEKQHACAGIRAALAKGEEKSNA